MPRPVWIAAGLLIVFAVFFGWHYFLYFSSVRFFSLGKGGRRLLGALLVLLPVSFFAVEILLRRASGGLVKAVTFAATLWLAVGLALLIWYLAAWVAWGVSAWMTPRPRLAWFGAGALAVTLVYCAYGVWNAYHPRVKTVEVAIRNLPPVWSERKLVQITDVHLGVVLDQGFLSDAVDQVNAQNPDVVVVTGDLFDGGDHNLATLAAPLNRIRAPLGVFYITGNHEGFIGTGNAVAAIKTTQARLLADEMVEIDGLQIIGLNYARDGFSRDLGAAIQKIGGYDRAKPSILLYHSPSQIPAVRSAGISLMISGHTHYGQMIPFSLVTRMVYGKYHRGLNVEDGFAVYTSPGTGAWGPMMRTGNSPEITVFRLRPE